MDNSSYKNSFPHKIHSVSITKVKISIMSREITTIYSQNPTNTSMLSVGTTMHFSNLDNEVHILTTEIEVFHIRSQQTD
jgi:hypothetical protein